MSQELINQGRTVYFSPCSLLVQEMLRAKRDLKLDKILKKFSRFDAFFIDDLGYVKQNREEMEVLFTLLAHRYERGSVMMGLLQNYRKNVWRQLLFPFSEVCRKKCVNGCSF